MNTILAKVTRAAFDATSKLLGVQLRAEGDEGDDASAGSADEQAAQVLSQLGVAVRPVVASTLRALGIEHGDDVLVVKLWDRAKSPTDLAVGETRLFSAGNVERVVRLLTGSVIVEAPEIRLGASATKRVNREGDSVDCGTLAFTFTGGSAATLSITYTPPSGMGSPTVLGTGSGTISIVGKTGTGSSKVRAED